MSGRVGAAAKWAIIGPGLLVVFLVAAVSLPAAHAEVPPQEPFATESGGGGTGLWLADGGMTFDLPAGEAPRLRALELDPDSQDQAIARSYYLAWEPVLMPVGGNLTGVMPITFYLTSDTAGVQVDFASAGACVECDPPYDNATPYFSWSGGTSFNEVPLRLDPGTYAPLVIPGGQVNYDCPTTCQDRTGPLAGERLRVGFFVQIPPGVEPAPRISIAYGSASTPSGVWLPGLAGPAPHLETARLWVENSPPELRDVAPTHPANQSLSCTWCTRERTYEIAFGSYRVPHDMQVVGGAVAAYWTKLVRQEFLMGPESCIVMQTSPLYYISVQVRINGGPALAPTGESGTCIYAPGGYSHARCAAFGTNCESSVGRLVGINLNGLLLKKDDLLALELVVKGEYVPEVSVLEFRYGGTYEPSTLTFGARVIPPPPGVEPAVLEPPVAEPSSTASENRSSPQRVHDIPGIGQLVPGPGPMPVVLAALCATMAVHRVLGSRTLRR